MEIKYKKGDIIEESRTGEYQVIMHGCNCFNTMGAGAALAIARAYPEAFAADRATIKGDRDKLGQYSIAQSGDIWVVNLYSQYSYGTHQRQIEYNALSSSLYTAAAALPKILNLPPSGISILMPCIGAGLAGGDWDTISEIIEHRLRKYSVTVCKLK
jgi:O-acetyl-ADP-ribose deacetylase (regulator of RNase III)